MQLTLDGVDKQDALAVLRNKSLERIDGGDHRVYRDTEGKEYHSVTHIPVSYTHLTLPTTTIV